MAWTYVQGKTAQPSTEGVTTLSGTFDSAVTAGNLIVARVSTWGGTTFTLQDNKNSTAYSEAVLYGPVDTGAFCAGIWWYVAPIGGSSFQVTMSTTGTGYPSMAIDEFSFSSGASISLDDTGYYAGDSTNPALDTPLIVTGNDLICTCVQYGLFTLISFTPTTGLTAGTYIERVPNIALGLHTEYGLNKTSNITPSSTIDPTGAWIVVGAAFKETAGSPPPPGYSSLMMDF